MSMTSQPVASERHIDVWLSFYDEIDADLDATLRALLSDAERRKELRFHFAADRKRYLVTRAMVRTVLSRYVPERGATDWEFSANRFGRPELCDPPAAARGLSFNISHTHGLIALAVARHRQLGVDVEHIHARHAALGIAQRFFAPVEAAELERVPEDRQQERFFEYWTFKESYIKARGEGLSIPLDAFDFCYPAQDEVRMSTRPGLFDDAQRWCFWQFRPTAHHLLALCAERHDCGAPTLSIRKMIPTVMDQPLAAHCVRSSKN